MSTPSVNLSEIDGALGILPGTGTKARAVAGVASSGPFETPAAFADVKKFIAAFGQGPGVSAGALVLGLYGVPILFCRTNQSVAGAYLDAVTAVPGSISAVDNTAVSGTSDFSDNSSAPLLAGSWQVVALAGGTRGTAGIVLQVFRDSVEVGVYPLGTAVNFAIGAGSGVSLALSAGTIVAGDVATFTTVAPIASSAGEVVIEGAGSSAITLAAGTHPDDSYEATIEITNGGTIGVDGIKLVWSLDGGRTPSAEYALGTAAFFIFPNSGGTRVNFGAGTLLTGQTIAFPTVEPQWNNTEIAAAIDALKASTIPWDGCHVVGAISATAFDVIDAKFNDKRHYWLGSTRLPVGSESEATYQASLAAAFASKSTLYGGLSSGADEPPDQVTGRKYKRPAMFAVSALDASVSEEVNIAQIDPPGGALKGSAITDAAGNAKHHDERTSPGLDDARFITLRTDEDYAGVFVNRPRVFSPAGSDFYLLPHRRVMNLAHVTVKAYFKRRLSKEILVSKKTGFMLPSTRVSMENGATKALRSVLLAKPKASDARVTLSPDDNVLSTRTITGKYRVVPLAYPETFNLEGGFENPATLITAV